VKAHLLRELTLPDRYERLAARLSNDLANLLVSPPVSSVNSLRLVANEVLIRDEGVLVPVQGRTGTGKTTFVMNVSKWLPEFFGPAFAYSGDLTFDVLVAGTKDFAKPLPADNRRIVPINIDHRENNPPSDTELAALKRFLRTNAAGVPSIAFWPETSADAATDLASRYTAIAGSTSIDLPLIYNGPSRETWHDIARHTLSLANRVDSLEDLGVDPRDYDTDQIHTLGDFLRTISHEFTKRVEALRQEFEKPISVLVVFASESSDPGVLSQLTSPSRYGLLDSHALVSVTSQSEVGKWWSGRRGLLTRTIVQLNAMGLCLSPTAAASCIRNFSDAVHVFDAVGYRRYGAARGIRDLGRSDLGKILKGIEVSRFEARGPPAEDATAAFQLLAEQGFNLGKDRNLNRIMQSAVQSFLRDSNVSFHKVTAEEALPFCGLIPDNAIYADDHIQCIEYTWRKGQFLSSSNRSTVAQYTLLKLQKYARQLGWTSD
jgi:hypothetical protein